MLWTNQIVGFFDHQYLMKEEHEGKVACETTAFGWVCQGMLGEWLD